MLKVNKVKIALKSVDTMSSGKLLIASHVRRPDRSDAHKGPSYTNRHMTGNQAEAMGIVEDIEQAKRMLVVKDEFSREQFKRAAKWVTLRYMRRHRVNGVTFYPHNPDHVGRVTECALRKWAGCFREKHVMEKFCKAYKHNLTKTQVEMSGEVDGIKVQGRADGIVNGDTIVEIKNREHQDYVSKKDIRQVYLYMHMSGLRKGVLVQHMEAEGGRLKVKKLAWSDAEWDKVKAMLKQESLL
jgi:hypothetical protein